MVNFNEGFTFKDLQDMIEKNKREGGYKYIGGFFDGEGAVMISKGGETIYSLRIKFVNTNLDVLLRIQKMFNRGYILIHSKRSDKWKESYALHFDNVDARYVLEKIEPYLIIKKERAEIGIEFDKRIEHTYSRGGARYKLSDEEIKIREAYYEKMKELNKRGPDNEDDGEFNEKIDLDKELENINKLYKEDSKQIKLEW